MENKVQDFLSFRRMITPVIIQIIFWIGVGVCVIAGIIGIIGGAVTRYGGGIQVLGGVLLLFLGPLGVRIYCELLIVLFRMNETLTKIRNNTALDEETTEEESEETAQDT